MHYLFFFFRENYDLYNNSLDQPLSFQTLNIYLIMKMRPKDHFLSSKAFLIVQEYLFSQSVTASNYCFLVITFHYVVRNVRENQYVFSSTKSLCRRYSHLSVYQLFGPIDLTKTMVLTYIITFHFVSHCCWQSVCNVLVSFFYLLFIIRFLCTMLVISS